MTIKRVKIGPVGGQFGIYMSKPGVDVESATPSQLVFSPNIPFFQVIYERTLTLTQVERSATQRVVRRIDHPDFGFIPLVTIDCTSKWFEYTSTTTQRNQISAPFSRYPFSQTRTGFYCIWHTVAIYTDGVWHYYSQGGGVKIRLYNVATTTTGYTVPSYDTLVPDT